MATTSSILNVALVQPDLVWENAFANRKTVENELVEVKNHPNVIILPEAFSTGFSMNAAKVAEPANGPTVQWMKALANDFDSAVCGSIFIKENNQFFNQFIWIDADGNRFNYNKRHLFSMGKENENYTPGNQQVLINYKGWKIFPQVCYDLRFPVWSRNNSGYDIMINVANWPSPRRKVWKTLLKARAIENQCFVVGVNRIGRDENGIYYSGDSMAIDYKGLVVTKAGKKQQVLQTAFSLEAIRQFRAKFNTLKDADEFNIHC